MPDPVTFALTMAARIAFDDKAQELKKAGKPAPKDDALWSGGKTSRKGK